MLTEYQNIPGWFDKTDADFYAWVASKLPAPATVAEIGVWQGRSTVCLSNLLPPGSHHICVDHFKGDPSAGFKNTRPEFDRFTNGLPLTVLQGDSVASASVFDNATFDFVFIDADHSYNAVLADITAWLPKVKPGGILAGHDIGFKSVRRAVSELLPNYIESANIWWITI
jgi:predicted O-methyltransferase YrrM